MLLEHRLDHLSAASSDSDAAWSATKRVGFLEVARVGIIKKP